MSSPIHYRLTITRLIENPNYESEKERIEAEYRNPRYDAQPSYPPKQLDEQTLATIIDEEQFAAIRKACIETMK